MYDGPIIDAHTHPMLGVDDGMGAEPHPPEAYRELVRGSAIVRAAALTIAPAGDLERTRARNDAVLRLAGGSGRFFFPVCPLQAIQAVRQLGFGESELEAIMHGNAAALISE